MMTELLGVLESLATPYKWIFIDRESKNFKNLKIVVTNERHPRFMCSMMTMKMLRLLKVFLYVTTIESCNELFIPS